MQLTNRVCPLHRYYFIRVIRNTSLRFLSFKTNSCILTTLFCEFGHNWMIAVTNKIFVLIHVFSANIISSVFLFCYLFLFACVIDKHNSAKLHIILFACILQYNQWYCCRALFQRKFF